MIDIVSKLKDVVVAIKTDADIFSALWHRIYIGQPMQEPSDNYLTINIITQVQNIEVNNRTRVEFRYIGGSEATPLDELSDIEAKVTKYFYQNYKELWFFKFEIGTVANGYDEKKRPAMIRDYILYYIT